MGIFKNKIDFDPTVPADHDKIGSYLISLAGDVITSETIGSNEHLHTAAAIFAADGTALTETGGALDVNLASSDLSDFDIRDLTHVSDSVSLGDGTSLFTSTTVAADIGLDVNIINASIAVTATDLDIRDLTHVSDSIKIGDGTDFLAVNADGSINVNLTDDGVADDEADAGNPLKVGSRAVDGLLTAISASNDRADLLSDMYRRVWVNTSANVGMKASDQDVTTTASELASTPLVGRTSIIIENTGDKAVYIGHDNTVTSANGIILYKDSSIEIPAGEDINIWAIAESGTQDIRILELG